MAGRRPPIRPADSRGPKGPDASTPGWRLARHPASARRRPTPTGDEASSTREELRCANHRPPGDAAIAGHLVRPAWVACCVSLSRANRSPKRCQRRPRPTHVRWRGIPCSGRRPARRTQGCCMRAVHRLPQGPSCPAESTARGSDSGVGWATSCEWGSHRGWLSRRPRTSTSQGPLHQQAGERTRTCGLGGSP